MIMLIRRSIILFLIILLIFSNSPVFAGVITTHSANQGSSFNPETTDFQTVITLDDSFSQDDINDNQYNTFDSALTKAKNADKPVLINVEPGNYSGKANITNICDIVISGTSNDPSDVIIEATNGSSVVELGNKTLEGFFNYTLENLTLKLTYNTAGTPQQTTGIQVGNTGLNRDITFRNIVIDASTSEFNDRSVNGIYLYNGQNITVDNVEFKAANPDMLRGIVLANTSDSKIENISGNCTIPVSALDYHDASKTYTAQFPSNNYIEGANFLISTIRGDRFAYIMAPTYEKVIEYTNLQLEQGGTIIRSVVDITNNQLLVDNNLFPFSSMEDYITGTDNINTTAIGRERASDDNWYDTKKVALINPSGDYTVNVEGLIITAYDENYSSDSYIPIATARFSGKPITMQNFDFSGLDDPTIAGMIEAGIIPSGSVVEPSDGDHNSGNIIWAKMTFNPNGGIVDKSYAIMPCDIYSSKDPRLPKPVREGYEFKGWFSQIDGKRTNQIVLSSEGITVYAEWDKAASKTTHDISDKNSINKKINNQSPVSGNESNRSPNTSDSVDSTVYAIIFTLSLLCLAIALQRRIKDMK